MSEYKSAPQIRFKGFSDAWEQRKLEDFGKATGGTSIESEFSENGIYKVISIGSYSENSKYNDQGIRAILSDKTKEKILNKSDLTMILNDKTANGRIIGRVLYIDKSGTYVYNQRTERIEIYKEYFEPIFIYQLLNAPQIRNKIIKQSQGNTQIFVNWNGIKNTDYLVPSKTEQVKLGELFTNLDNLITLHQRKYDNLVNVKKSLLEKMFPKNSSNVPEIRFKGFADAWEQRKFENIFNYERPDKYIVNSTEYLEFGPTPVLTANKAFILGYTTEKNKYVNSHESIIFDDFTLDTKFVDFPYMVKSSAIKILTLKDEKKDNIRFNFELLSNHRFNMLGHARHYISVVQPENVFTTNKQEQNKIGDLFTNIDNLITLHQRKLEKLNELKKSMLDKMFI